VKCIHQKGYTLANSRSEYINEVLYEICFYFCNWNSW